MNTITKTILDKYFGEYRSILGSLIKAYVECQKKINSIVKRKNSNIDIDIRLCYLHSQAQNYLLMEILINYLIITKIHEINEGVLKLYGGKRTRVRKRGGKKGGGKKTKKLISPIINTKNTKNISKIISFFSLFLLLSLKMYTAKANNHGSLHKQPAFKFENKGPVELDPLNDGHMKDETDGYGTVYERPERKVIRSANITELFSKDSNSVFSSLFASLSSDKFNRDVVEKTKSLMNDNVYKVHSSLVKLCEKTFIEKSTDLSPIRLADLFVKINETESGKRIEYQEELLDAIEQPDSQSLLSSVLDLISPATSDSEKQIIVGQETEMNVQAIVEQANIKMDKMIEQSIMEGQYRQTGLQNRERYLEYICEYSIKIPELQFNQSDGTIAFTSFPYSREMVEVLLRNVMEYTERHIREASDEDEVRRPGAHEAQRQQAPRWRRAHRQSC